VEEESTNADEVQMLRNEEVQMLRSSTKGGLRVDTAEEFRNGGKEKDDHASGANVRSYSMEDAIAHWFDSRDDANGSLSYGLPCDDLCRRPLRDETRLHSFLEEALFLLDDGGRALVSLV
jgi:hypothetical protein